MRNALRSPADSATVIRGRDRGRKRDASGASPAASERRAEGDERIEVLVSLGSNIAPERHLPRAVEALSAAPELRVLACSSVWRSEAVGSDGPAFLNAALRLRLRRGSGLSPVALKYDVLRPIERSLGRRRSTDKNAPRTIDLDLSLFGDLVLRSRQGERVIELPDPELLTRAHVALPLAEIAPTWRHPTDGRRLRQIAGDLDTGGVQAIDGPWLPLIASRLER